MLNASVNRNKKRTRVQDNSNNNVVNEESELENGEMHQLQTCSNGETQLHPTNSDMTIAIIGGGIGGLATALALQQEGFKVALFERDNKFEDRKQGYGLTLINNKVGPMAKLGILDEVIKNDCPSYQHWVFRSNGQVMGYYGRGFASERTEESRVNRGNIRIPRQELRRLLMNKLQSNCIFWGYKFKSCFPTPTHVDIEFDNGETFRADVLIGADGLRSRVREIRDQYVDKTGNNNLRYIGISVILGLSSSKHALLEKSGFYALNGKCRIFTMPFTLDEENNQSVTMWQLSFSGLTEDESMKLKTSEPPELFRLANQLTEGWLDGVSDLINTTTAENIWATPLFDRLPMTQRTKDVAQDKSYGRISVIGDACHPMSMFKGQGANQALEDAPLLAKWLSKLQTVTRVYNLYNRIRCFEREMIDRSKGKVAASFEAAQLYHSPEVMNRPNKIEGIDDIKSHWLIKALESHDIGASFGKELLPKCLEYLSKYEQNNSSSTETS